MLPYGAYPPLLFLCQLANVLVMVQNPAIVFPLMGNLAVGAILIAILRVPEGAAAAVAQGIQWTIAEQAAEILRVCTGVTG